MRSKQTITILLAALALSAISYGQPAKPAVNFLGVAGPIAFNQKSFLLSWSSHPTATYYKHEYLAKGEDANSFKNMILLEIVIGDSPVKDIVAGKIAELKKMKETNPIVNYESFDNPKTGEYMIDFLLSANGADGKLSIIERNVYRYKSFTAKSGQKGIMLFAVSTRSYGNQIDAFLIALKKTKADLVNKVAQFTLPEITIAK